MNIFVLDEDIRLAAQYHMDVHVIKQILETAQMLSTAHWASNSNYTPQYKMTHKNHGCNLWLVKSQANYKWLCAFGLALCDEFRYRRGKEHKSEAVLKDLALHVPPIPNLPLTEHYKAVGKDEDLRALPVVECYRAYYNRYKQFYIRKTRNGKETKIYASWTGRSVPNWFKQIRIEPPDLQKINFELSA